MSLNFYEISGGYGIGDDTEIRGNGVTGNLPETFTILSKYNEKNIVEIGKFAFANVKIVKNIILNEGIVTLCWSSFRSIPNLVSISLPSSLQIIGQNCFDDCCIQKSHCNNECSP